MKGDREDVVSVPSKHLARAPVDLPHANGLVRTARGDAAAVVTERHGADPPIVPGEQGRRLVRVGVEQADLLFVGADARQPAAIRAVSDRLGIVPGSQAEAGNHRAGRGV